MGPATEETSVDRRLKAQSRDNKIHLKPPHSKAICRSNVKPLLAKYRRDTIIGLAVNENARSWIRPKKKALAAKTSEVATGGFVLQCPANRLVASP